MCGIVGVLGSGPAAPIIVNALRLLEYRGYDSAGVATLHEGSLDRRRAVGKLNALAELLQHNPIHGSIGIGHTRWATHGAVTETNAHPHSVGKVAVVHNGIIENFRELREMLTEAGRTFVSQTDTETIAQLCDHHMSQGLSPVDAAGATIAKLEGAFALAILFDGEEDLMVCARKGCPLAIGYGDGEMYVGSDAVALAPMTNRVCFIEEGDWAVLTRAGATIYDEAGTLVNREVRVVSVSPALAEKGEYRHFMAKEIHEQPSVVGYTLGAYLNENRDAIADIAADIDFANASRLTIVACGTASYAGEVAKYWFEQVARLPVEVDIASEFRYRTPPMPENGISLFVSQSGETADTLAALQYAKSQGQQIVSIVNVPESTIARSSDVVLPTHAGPEIGVASTKAFTCQLTVLAALTLAAARARGRIDAAEEARLVRTLSEVPRLLAEAIATEDLTIPLSQELAKATDGLYLGRGSIFPLAMEGALKLKEISYIHAEGYASGELKHGPIALIDEQMPVVVLAPRDGLFEKTVSNMQEVMARGGKVLLVSDEEGIAEAGEGCWRTLKMPTCDPFIAPIIYAAPTQFIAYHTAVAKGTDVDQPRNLAKSVTVE